jgi:hypothetical protein
VRRPTWPLPRDQRLTADEQSSLTHGDFWIPELEREVYKRALQALNAAAVQYVVAGAYAIYEYTGIYRQTKDLDLLLEPQYVIAAAEALRAAGFVTRLEDEHWIAKAKHDRHFIDLIYGMGNGLAFIDAGWYRYSRPGLLAATQVRIAPAEELIWHRLFISERHRHDMSDIVHVILCVGDVLDWERLVERTGPHWPLLLAQLQMFSYVYPGYHALVPGWVMRTLLDRARDEVGRDAAGDPTTRGTLISRFSFSIDVREWGFVDPRAELIDRMRSTEDVRAISSAAVWDERGDDEAPGNGGS